MGKNPIVSVAYENEMISTKENLPYIKCVTALLCGPWADLWPFCGLYCKRFSLIPRLGSPAKRPDGFTAEKRL